MKSSLRFRLNEFDADEDDDDDGESDVDAFESSIIGRRKQMSKENFARCYVCYWVTRILFCWPYYALLCFRCCHLKR